MRCEKVVFDLGDQVRQGRPQFSCESSPLLEDARLLI